jgi:transcriptional regulator with XRE-family HTH domain
VAERSSAAREARRQAEELAVWLRAWIRHRGSSAAEVSRRLGFAPAYLTRVFNGDYPLRLAVVFAILSALGARPRDFFAGPYRPAAPGPRTLPEVATGTLDAEEPARQALAALVEASEPALSAAEWADRAARLLRQAILWARTTQRAVGRTLGLPPDALGQALRKAQGLTAWQIFGVLAAIGMAPAEFFARLFSPQDDEVAPGLRRADLREALTRLDLTASAAGEGSAVKNVAGGREGRP